ncbi:hypothetical protein CKA32_001592 [Geitlerinema sp. FC II]|nr:hypothetical protein [Geitlerinema sp. CS-897]PPT10370.1 hypothetical protein CKA32_001592 [Geitlerinema sp. FC II]
MSEFNTKSNIFNKIVVPVIVTILVGGTSPWWWQEIFAKGNLESKNNDVTETDSNTSTAEISHPNSIVLDDRFLGNWSSEGDIRASHILELEIETVSNGELSGILRSRNIESGGYSGVMSIIGEPKSDAIAVEIFDGRGFEVGEAELSLEDETLTWRLNRSQGISEETLPSLSYLWKYE